MFRGLSITAGNPWWLLLLLVVLPPLVLFSVRSLAGLGRFRRAVAILLRAGIVTLIVLALAELQTVRKSDRLATLFLVDATQSMPNESQADVLRYVTGASKNRIGEDLTGVIVFGKQPMVETPPSPMEVNLLAVENSLVDREYTDIGSAIKLALATFPEDAARRIVLLSDGNENRGNALEQALNASRLGVQIDVVPIEYDYDREVLVEKVSIPPDVKEGETVKITVVVRASEPTTGTLQIFQKTDNYRAPATGNEQPLPVELRRGLNVFELKQKITERNFYTFQATYMPDKGTGDRRGINNTAEGFTHARGTAQVMLIEGTRGEHAELVRALREKKIEVTVLVAPKIDGSGAVGGDPLPTDLAQLQPYDAVILANVPKEAFTEAQHQLFESNVHDMGGGLIMLGGRDSFGAGGWMNTPVERALPVDMQIKSLKVEGIGAMVLIMHATEIAEGNYWQKVIAKASINALSNQDFAGLMHFEGREAWLFTLRPVGTGRPVMLKNIDRMTPGDMPDFGPLVAESMRGLLGVKDAMTRHIVVISDGDPAPPTPQLINDLIKNKITVTTVLTAAHGNDAVSFSVMRNLANKTKGRFYNVTNPKALPRIYQKEARSISRPLIFDRDTPWTPTINYLSEPVIGLPAELPPISGLVLTTLKENELVEMPLSSPLPKGQTNPLLAHWTYGLGRSVAFTSDAGRRWAKAWPDWESYAAFWSQVVRWSMRPVDRGNLTLTVRRDEGRIKVVVDALDKDNNFLNFLQVQGNVVSPDLKRSTIELAQTAPGKYEGVIDDAEASGNYFVNLGYRGPDNLQGVISSGISVPYSDEYRELRSNPAILESLASVTNGRVTTWKRAPDKTIDLARTLAGVNHFRRDAGLVYPTASTPLWPNLLWLAALLFLGDVAVRRVAPDLDRIRKALADQWKKLRGQEVVPAVEYMEKLKGRKAEVAEQIDRARAATRFEAPPVALTPLDEPLLGDGDAPPPRPRQAPPSGAPGLAPDAPKPNEPESYTNRLLKAKQKVWEDRDKK